MPPGDPDTSELREILVPTRKLEQLEPLVGRFRYNELMRAAAVTHALLNGRAVWNISSTAAGGGVAEMLQVLVGYILDAGIDIHWLVIAGDSDFFSITKRIHNRLHGAKGDGGALGASEAAHYTALTAAAAKRAIERTRAGDVVLLHDPQTAGMVPPLTEAGRRVVWRCHVGGDERNEWTDQAWSFLRPHMSAAEAFIFSIQGHVPSWLDASKVWIIPPSIDPFSQKNAELSREAVLRTLGDIGLLAGVASHAPMSFTRRDGTRGTLRGRASILSEAPLGPDAALVVQVSRWDRLKDMAGVMEGFAGYVVGQADAQLALVGPSVNEVSDDPEEAEVFEECVSAWHDLPLPARRCVRLVTLPMEDIDENATMVNAVQRHATLVTQKSLAEGFGLTVAEAMWKSRPVIASAVGGIATQITPGTGRLLKDPTDLATFGSIVLDLLAHPDEAADLGAQAHRRVLEAFVGDEHLKRHAHLIGWLMTN